MNKRFRIVSDTISSAMMMVTIIAFGAFFYSCSSGTSDVEQYSGNLAEIGDFSVSEKHFQASFKRYYERSGRSLSVTDDMKRAVLDTELNIYTAVTFAQDEGWDVDPQGQRRYEQIRRQVMMEEYDRRVLFDNMEITEEHLIELYYRTNTHLRASHLYARDRNTIDSLYALLQAGHDFTELAAQTFESSQLRESGGDLGFFTVDEMDIGFEDAAYRLQEGEISKPVRTSRGYSIIKVTEILTKPILSEYDYAVRKSNLRALANNQVSELARRNNLYETISNINLNEQVLRELWATVRDDFRNAVDGHIDEVSFLQVPPELGNKKLADNEHLSLDVNGFMQEVYYTPDEGRSNVTSYNQFLKFAEGLAFRTHALNIITNHPAKDRWYVDGAIEATFHRYLNRRLFDYLTESVEIDEDVIRREFETNRMYYQHPVELNLAELMMKDWDESEIAFNKLQAGKDFLEVLDEYGYDAEAKLFGGELGFVPITNFGGLAPALSNKQHGDYAGPFEVQKDVIFIFKVLGRKEARPMSFEEAKEEIRQGMMEQEIEKKRSRILAETREKHNASVNYAKLREVTISL